MMVMILMVFLAVSPVAAHPGTLIIGDKTLMLSIAGQSALRLVAPLLRHHLPDLPLVQQVNAPYQQGLL